MRTIDRFALAVGAIGLMLPISEVFGQTEMNRSLGEPHLSFYSDAIVYASDQPQKSRIELYVQVPHDEIRFIKEGDQYIARYEVNVTLSTAEKQVVQEQTWNVDVPVSDFSQTSQTKLYSLSHRMMDVDPGNYQLLIQVKDQESRKTSQQRKALLVTDFSKDSLSMSDIMLVNRLSTDGQRRSIVPNISGTINYLSEGFFVFCELYSNVRSDSVDIVWKIYDSKKNEVVSRSKRQATTGHMTEVFCRVDSTGLKMGPYYVTIEATSQIAAGVKPAILKATTSRTFSVRALDLPLSVVDLDKAVDQLIYIARESELAYIKEAPNQDEKLKRFLEFWAKRDPDRSTARNELMEEYYARVQSPA